MDEIVPGIYHWSTYHPGIGQQVHSHYVAPARALLDPKLPSEDALAWFEGEHRPQRIVLSQRHHWRDCRLLARELGIPILCQEDGARLLEPGREVESFAFGEQPAPGIVAYEVWSGWPGETALHMPEQGALLIADAVIGDGRGGLRFVPDPLLGDDPEQARRGLGAGLLRLAEELEFDTLLRAHAEPIVSGGRERLLAFAREA